MVLPSCAPVEIGSLIGTHLATGGGPVTTIRLVTMGPVQDRIPTGRLIKNMFVFLD